MSFKITIQLVTWNSAYDLEWSLPTWQNIPAELATIRFIDNHSTDNSVVLVRRFLPHAEIIELPVNTGFSGGQNVGFTRCTTDLVLIVNPDVKLSWEGIQKLIEVFDDDQVGAAQGKLLREQDMISKKTIIDSAGIVLTNTLNGHDRGADEEDKGQYNVPALIIAPTGACAMYRLSALCDIAYLDQEFFDNDFFAYKEDVDLGWRLNKAGWKVLYQPVVTGTHIRKLKRQGRLNWGTSASAIYERLKSSRTRYSFRNWVWMIAKNATPKQYLAHCIFIQARLLIFFLMSLIYWPFFQVWGEIVRGLPKMRAKRK